MDGLVEESLGTFEGSCGTLFDSSSSAGSVARECSIWDHGGFKDLPGDPNAEAENESHQNSHQLFSFGDIAIVQNLLCKPLWVCDFFFPFYYN